MPLQLATGQEIILRNVLFESNSDELLETSTEELNRLVQLLEQNIDLHIQINGHTDNIGDEDDNQLLSKNRAKSVTDFLVKAGINKKRLSSKGHGESQPIADNKDETGRSKNRRTSFKIVD